jgi:hypothetical protein
VSLKQRVKLELEDGSEVDVTFDGRDLRAWEVKHRRSAIAETTSISMLSWLGWHAAQRQGLLNGSYGTWESFDAVATGVEGLPDEDEEEESSEGPTKTPGARATRKTASAS